MSGKLEELFSEGRILFMDGAIGTIIQKYALSEEDFRGSIFNGCGKELKGNNECLNLTRADILKEIHREYILAGADIITSNTFSANRIAQEEYGCGDYAFKMAYEGARLAREVADSATRKVLVAGSIGPTSKSLSLSPDMNDPAFRPFSFDEMEEAYSEQIRGLISGGADLLLLETCFDALNVKAALHAISKVNQGKYFPTIISATVSDRSGRTLTGQTLEAFYTSVRHWPLAAFGLNCSLGAEEMYPLVKEVAGFAQCPVICYPNAGLPDGMGGYAQSASEMAAAMRKMAGDSLVNIVGGCCGTTPEFIGEIVAAVKDCPPRALPSTAAECLTVSGLEAVHIDTEQFNFTNIGERTNVAGSKKFARLISSGNYTEAMQVAADQIGSGASVIDVNMDDAMLDSTAEMTRFTRYISNDPAVAQAALMIDSSHWETILAGLKNAQGKCIVNSISLKEGEEAFLSKAREIHALGGAMVVMAFDEKGQATDYERKIEICSRAWNLLREKAGIPAHDIIFDVNVLAIGTGIEEHANYGTDFIKAVKWIKENLPGALTSGGISNLSFSFRGNNPVREAMHSAFLYHAIKAGLDMAIINPAMLQVYDDIEPEMLKCVEDVIFNTDSGATERLIEKAARTAAEAGAGAAGDPANDSAASERNSSESIRVEDRLSEALVKGGSATLEADLKECIEKGRTAVSIIEGPLMDGMKRVGDLFGEGKMFLPQVVKSAKIMRLAVDFLQPYMDVANDSDKEAARPKVVIATVKGDVHDIGKNITSIVLGCNGFEVIDLGVMVDREDIIAAALEHNADIIGASGLITPSLHQMEELCRSMSEKGMSTPLFIGGATTSALHTAVKLAPLYDHVFYGADASATAVMAKSYMIAPQGFEEKEHLKQQEIRDLYLKGLNRQAARAGDAADSPGFSAESYPRIGHRLAGEGRILSLEDVPVKEISLGAVLPYFDWMMFYAIWGMKYGQTDPNAPEVVQLRSEAEAAIEKMSETDSVRIMLGVKWFEAYSENGNIILTGEAATGSGSPVSAVLPMMRQTKPTKLSSGACARLSLSDFVPAKESGFTSPAGLFALSVEPRHGSGCSCSECSARDEYGSLMDRAVMNTLAEAASTWIDGLIPQGFRHIKPAAGYSSCPDHTLKRDILDLLPDSEKLGITLTESCGMIPDASVCGMILIHPEACYPEIRGISRAAYEDYLARRGMSPEDGRRFLGHLLRT